jgi:iron complex outermembrane receptor protein
LKCLFFATGSLLVTSSIWAATAGAEASAAENEAAPVTELQEITVTARRRTENLESVPVAITAVSGQDLAKNGVRDINALQAQVPSLVIASNGEADRANLNFVIRGQGQVYGEFTPSVVTYFAEVPTAAPGASLFYDLQNVQVLKGPQGTLFGKNTTGGALLFLPNRPSYDGLKADFSVRAGNYDMVESDGFVNIPVVDDKLGMRIAYNYGTRKGYTYDLTSHRDLDNEDYYAFRLGILANPTERFENYLVASFYNDHTNNSSAQINSVNPASPLTGIFGYYALLAAQQARGPRVVQSSVLDPYRKDFDLAVTDIATFKVSDMFSLKNILGYRVDRDRYANDVDGSAAPIIDFPAGSTYQDYNTRYSEELQALVDAFDKRLNLIIGVYTDYIHPDPQALQSNLQVGNATYRLNQTTAYSTAGFAQGTYDLRDLLAGLKLTSGVRYTQDRVSNRAGQWAGPSTFFDPAVDTCQVANSDPGSCIYSAGARFHHTSWLVSLDYQITEGTLVYAATRNGYKSGGKNGFIPDPSYSSYGLETVQDYEVGIKTNFHAGSVPVRINADAYSGNYDNIQRAIIIVTPTGIYAPISTGTVVNGVNQPNKAVVRGLELEWQAQLLPDLRLSGFYNYTDAHYTNYYLSFLGIGTFDVKYTDFSFTPRNKAGMTLDYTLPIRADIGKVSVSANYTYQSAERFGNDPRVIRQIDLLYDPADIPGYGLLNWRVDWSNVMNKGFDLGFFMTNALNRSYLDFEGNYFGLLGMSPGQYGPPRFFGAEVRYHLNP